ncbi:MAG: hypothetical protein ACUZ8N_01930 [Candidatus Scalindua sp.]
MKSIYNLRNQHASIPILADDVLEFHASRLLLLLRLCGKKGGIDGLTKMAKLDFFVRYPDFFSRVCEKLGHGDSTYSKTVESSMIRYHYGPWDNRYYHVLSYLEAKELITISTKGKMYKLELTNSGKNISSRFIKNPSFVELVEQMKKVKKLLGNKNGSTLKKLIYRMFEDEVSKRSLGKVIDQ